MNEMNVSASIRFETTGSHNKLTLFIWSDVSCGWFRLIRLIRERAKNSNKNYNDRSSKKCRIVVVSGDVKKRFAVNYKYANCLLSSLHYTLKPIFSLLFFLLLLKIALLLAPSSPSPSSGCSQACRWWWRALIIFYVCIPYN